MAPSPQHPLNGKGVQRISGYKFQFKNRKKTQIGIRLGTSNIGCLCDRGTEMAEELKKRKINICGLQEIPWKGQGARFIGVEGRKYKL